MTGVRMEPEAKLGCYLCGKEKYEVVSRKLRYGENKTVVRCLNCGLIFIYPYMSIAEERRFYEEEYGKIFSKEKNTSVEELFNARLPEAEEYYKLTKDYLTPDLDCLELGCASGYFLYYIRDKVKSVTGYEPFVAFNSYCRKIGVDLINNLETCPEKKFDRIFMFFLLEHLADPLPYLGNINRFLKDKGYLFIELPNVEDALLTVYKVPAFIDFYYTLAHPFYYSKETLTRLLQKAGFKDFNISPVQRYDLSNHVHWMLTGKPGGVGRFNDIFSQELLDNYAGDLKKYFRCDTLFAVVKKF